jgi:hypothetical protein
MKHCSNLKVFTNLGPLLRRVFFFFFTFSLNEGNKTLYKESVASTFNLFLSHILNPFIYFSLPLFFFSSLLALSFLSPNLSLLFHIFFSPTLTSLIFFLSTSIFLFLHSLILTKTESIGLKIQLRGNHFLTFFFSYLESVHIFLSLSLSPFFPLQVFHSHSMSLSLSNINISHLLLSTSIFLFLHSSTLTKTESIGLKIQLGGNYFLNLFFSPYQ